MDAGISMWTERTLQRLAADQEKVSLTVDCERSNALGKTDDRKNQLANDVSAMANSAGGVLAYGMAEKEAHESPTQRRL